MGIISRLMFTEIPRAVSENERRVLRLIVEQEDEELAQGFPGGWWVGNKQVSGKTCFRLIRHALISKDKVGGNEEVKGGMIYWHINETGKRVLKNPNYVPWTIRMANGEKGPFNE